MGTEIDNFPEAAAWAAHLPRLGEKFGAVSPRRSAGAPAESQADREYAKFARVDLSTSL